MKCFSERVFVCVCVCVKLWGFEGRQVPRGVGKMGDRSHVDAREWSFEWTKSSSLAWNWRCLECFEGCHQWVLSSLHALFAIMWFNWLKKIICSTYGSICSYIVSVVEILNWISLNAYPEFLLGSMWLKLRVFDVLIYGFKLAGATELEPSWAEVHYALKLYSVFLSRWI